MKHKGNLIPNNWSKVYHKSNPLFRASIDTNGLIIMKGDSYECHSPEDTEPPAVFAYNKDIEEYDSTYDDDIWEIDTSKITNEFFIDKEVGDGKSACVTYANIPREAIKLVYEGTGKDLL